MPEDAPAFFAAAFGRARAAKKPIVIDFWAEWCGPCIRLKKQTLASPEVSGALGAFELIYVDLDKYPRLAEAYGVKSIPDVFFIDAQGTIVDRLLTFEEAKPFLERLRRVLEAKPRNAGERPEEAEREDGVKRARE